MNESESPIEGFDPKPGQVRLKGSKAEVQKAVQDLTAAGYKCGEMSEGSEGKFQVVCEKAPE